MMTVTVAASGCTSFGAREYVVIEHAVLPVEQAKGLTREEFELRLGLKPSGLRLVRSAALEKGSLVEVVANADLGLEGSCPSGGFASVLWRYGEQIGPYVFPDNRLSPPAIFRDDRYEGPAENVQRTGENAELPASIVTTCTEVRNAANPGQLILAPVAVTQVGLLAIFNAGKPGPHDINPTLATLRLGSPPPGGLEAWLGRLPDDALPLMRSDTRLEVGLYTLQPLKPDVHAPYHAVKVTFEQGLVAKLEASGAMKCKLTPARALQCAA
ncbi:MAG: hypothetical protein QM773_16095 [Hyphomonadaceae bacterium]